jgi:hypothetical protein
LFPVITNVAEMTDDTPFHNANKGYHTRKTKNSVFIERTQETQKQPRQYNRKKNNNSKDKILPLQI